MSMKASTPRYAQAIHEHTDYLVPLKHEHNFPKERSIKSLENKFSSSTSPPSNNYFDSIYLPISLLLYLGIPIAQLVIGFIYIDQCPIRQMIVVWMIVSGIVGILFVIIGLIIHLKSRKQSFSLSLYDQSRSYPLTIRFLLLIFILMLLFIIAWFFAGQVFVFEIKLRVELRDSTLPEYCHGKLYKSAYIIIFIDYIIFFLAIILNILSYVSPPDDSPNLDPVKPRSVQ